MITIEISDEDWEAIAEALDDPEMEPRIRRKLLAIRLHGLGVPHAEIAGSLNVSDDTVTNYINLYRDEGLGGLVENRFYRPTSSVEEFLGMIWSFSRIFVPSGCGRQRYYVLGGRGGDTRPRFRQCQDYRIGQCGHRLRTGSQARRGLSGGRDQPW